ncbi:HEAT repeat domain-containing protein [Paenibacillus piscarius]|uniref:HEAT repeat domain-containing protein n=1 Tax=Paenibacillus piscarius TaxID=1089681 RepID=UPI001EE8B4CE|nr:HEAT repeat domain-containing protein [Paenibacillus piscarius]
MSTALLQELHQEYRRLYIAGSGLAAGDFRLKRLLPQLQQLGERSPVFKKLGEGAAALLEPADADESVQGAALLEHTLLLESVLYTQGTTQVEGTPGPVPVRKLTLRTAQPYRKLAPVLEALSTTGSGRYEIVVDAFKEGIFADMRLLPLAVSALNDPYSELADYVKEEILPSYGPEISIYLLEGFNPAGGRSEARKLEAIAKAGVSGHLETIYHAAQSGSDEVRVAAIPCLAGDEEYIPALLAWSADKKKAIREAAYKGLAAGGSGQGAERLYEAYCDGKDRDMVAEVLANRPAVLAAEKLADLFMEKLHQAPQDNSDPKQTEAAWIEIKQLMRALLMARSRKLDEIYSYVISGYDRFLGLGWRILLTEAARYKQSSETETSLRELQELAERDYNYLLYYFRAARRMMNKKELYNHFAGGLKQKLLSFMRKEKDAAQREQALIDILDRVIINPRAPYNYRTVDTYQRISPEEIEASWDPRWLDWFIQRDALNPACSFARPGHQGGRDYLLKKLKTPPQPSDDEVLSNLFTGLERAGVPEPERLELLMAVLENGRFEHMSQFSPSLTRLMERFPPGYRSRLEAVTPRYGSVAKRQLEYLLSTINLT